MEVTPYLFFNGRCEEALEFYRGALGAEVTAMMRFGDVPDPSMAPPGTEKKIMHSVLRIGETTVFASDGCDPAGSASFQGFGLTLSPADVAEAERLYDALADGGQRQTPLEQVFFAQRFGVVIDRFGVSWLIVVQ